MTDLGVIFGPFFPASTLRATAEAADHSGVDELWLWEDCFDHGGFTTATAALAWTERVRVGVGVLPVPLRNVALTAMETVTLEAMFPGRALIGVGHGVLDWMAQVGARAESPMTLLREYVTALQGLLRGETLDVEGRYVTLHDVRLGTVPDPLPTLHVAARGPKTLALAGELADGVVVDSGLPPRMIREARAAFDAGRGDRPGRGRVTAYLLTVIGEDAERRFRAAVTDKGLAERARDAEEAAQVGVFGGPEGVAEAVRRCADGGADAVVLQPLGDEDPVAFARFAGEQVKPLL